MMKHAVDHLHHELKHLRTGRASLALLDGVMADYYGNPTPLNQLATLSVADASMIVAQPYDPSQISVIERAIRKS
ncbi:MAG TPA: ribosome-recycling factor, partial [Acidobacteria bacterium]|nr:ribosome-recycling factor [Acidobacteriota bacterium]